MLANRTGIKCFIGAAFASISFFASAALAQSTAAKTIPQVAVASISTAPAKVPSPNSTPDAKAAEGTKDVQAELDAVKAENAAVREQFRKMEEQQKALLELVQQMKRKLDTSGPQSLFPGDVANTGDTNPSENAKAAQRDVAVVTPAPTEDRYQEGIVIWKTADDAKVPFLLRFNNNTQFRYLNTLDSTDHFTDHLGVVREVHRRNDLTVNRAMFILGGYIWDKRLRYSLTVWTSAGSASIVVAGNIGWQFNKKLTVTGGYFGVPGSRSLVNAFPYFASTDRTMADNFFRPAFTQGVQVNGDLTKNLHYLALVGNGLNTLNVTAAKIDTNILTAGTIWWEPLGDYGPGSGTKTVNMYDDYFAQKKLRIRLGTSFTRSREDRFSNLDVTSPENVALYNSDGVLTFSTGAFAPGVTVDKASYKMWAIDWGLKYNGFAINGQYYFRWLNNFEADGPLPLDSTFDHGFEMSAGKFVVPKKLMAYARGSMVFGQFGNSHEYAGGLKWHFLPTERLWLQTELMRVFKVPYSGTFTPYTAGLTGWVPMVQTVIGF